MMNTKKLLGKIEKSVLVGNQKLKPMGSDMVHHFTQLKFQVPETKSLLVQVLKPKSLLVCVPELCIPLFDTFRAYVIVIHNFGSQVEAHTLRIFS